MKVLGRKLNRKAVSPVIATLLMIAIAVAASILVYVWSMGLVGSLQGTGGQQTREQLIMEAYVATATPIRLYLRNVGPTTSVVSAVYIEGVPASSFSGTITYAPGSTGVLTVSPGQTLTLGASYTVKIVTASGAVFSYSIIYGRAA
ncbi:MAG: archaellin/type IV pilin N-terminal domain-containing protein [Candidatus Bathyarchaeia archaeon]